MDTRHNLNRLVHFVTVVEEGTITAAADRLGLSKAVVSKQLQLLEEELGVVLLLRNTRRQQPSEAGRLFYAQARAILLQAAEAFEAVSQQGGTPRGRLRIAAPVDFGMSTVAPLVALFQAAQPAVQVELALSDMQVDMIEQRCDLSFRIGWLKDSSNLARKLKDFSEIVVCSPLLLEKWSIQTPEDLQAMPFAANMVLDQPNRWTFHRNGKATKVEMKVAISSNITTAIREVVRNGTCFSILPDFLVNEDLVAGRLIRLLPDWSLRQGGIYIVTPPGRLRSSAAQAFLDAIQHNIFVKHPTSS